MTHHFYKTTFWLINCFLFSSLSLSAQYVTIPDANFRGYLQQTFPSCFNASNQLDTTCTQITSITYLNVAYKNIANLTGVRYFDALTNLYCSGNQLTTLPPLPNTVTYIECQNNDLTSLGSLPPNLHTLTANHNNLTSLPVLPNSLVMMNVSYNQIASLPTLPSGLLLLNCEHNAISSLPSLSANLAWLHCGFNQLTNLPSLPNSLYHLTFYMNQIPSSAIPANLPQNLLQFDGSLNPLTVFPNFSNCPNIEGISVAGTQIPTIPPLPSTLRDFRCHNNLQITSLPTMPPLLRILEMQNCNIPVLPALPNGLQALQASNNNITNFPAVLPDSLSSLICDSCNISSLTSIPTKLYLLSCNNNINLSCLPLLPLAMDYITVSGTSITCLPNIPLNLSTLAPSNINTVCGLASGCALYPQVAGKVFADVNNNGTQDVGENPIAQKVIQFQPGNWSAITNVNGEYVANIPANTAFTETTPNLMYYTTNPGSYNVNLAMGQTVTANNFALYPTPNVNDLRITILSGIARPGFDMNYWITYENEGTTSLTGSVSFTYNNGILTFLNSSTAPASQSGNVLTWNFSNLAPMATGNVHLVFNVSATTPLGTPLSATASILPNSNDATPNNNTETDNRVVQGSYDPNEKLVNRSALTPAQVSAGTDLEYTIFFQNTGTDTAFNIKVIDSLTQKLDFATFEVLAASHTCNVSFSNPRALIFQFPNILLPDSNINEPESHGFVKYRIRPQTSLVLGEVIPNRADIYFDYNVPILTNVATTTISTTIGLDEGMKEAFLVYPNPATDKLMIQTQGDAVVTLQDLQGRILQKKAISKVAELEVKGYSAGLYLIQVQQEGNTTTQKVEIH
ncbi:MAG: T9SS type A sorting domain-containing protein [Bacteroidia bacterium]